jgi:eukaryotic-like serine/threonine-protein kinase
MPLSFDRVKEVFLAALEATPAARPALLAEQCAGDADLRARVEAMLRAHNEDDVLDRPLVEPPPTVPPGPAAEGPGTVVANRYRLEELIGEGGMGAVWRAEQTAPVRRTVALKVVKAGMDSREILTRFEAERQALAVMDHPHIAKVLDGGTTPAGRPFFVMEFVEGVPLTEYCDAERLDVPGRLALFVQVCQAVQHAHQKGVIHRDLKPSNVLVGKAEGGPVPKVIDFGLAKATRQPLTAVTLHTGPGFLMGTLQYMAPEQAELDNPDIDTRADVYALGVILYELLTGSPPLDRQQIKQAAWLEMLRLIQEEEPPRPSDRLSGSGSLPSLAAQRAQEPARLTKLVRGDLDWIVMKALEKDRARRYETANGFAADVQRYLIGDPVSAHPPSAAYRLRKFARRNRPQVVAAGLVLLALLAGVIGTTIGLVKARDQAQIARTERDAKETARQEEAAQRALAEVRLSKLETGVEILGKVLGDIDPAAEKRGGDPVQVAIGKQLTRAADELKGDAVGDRLVVARLQGILGRSLVGVGQYAKATEVLEQAVATRAELLGPEHADTLLFRIHVAIAYVQRGEIGRAIELFEASLPGLARELPATAPDVLSARGQYANALIAGRRPKEAIPLLTALADDYRAAGRAGSQDALVARNILAHAHLSTQNVKQAIAVLEPLVQDCVNYLGIDHHDTLVPRNNLAIAYNLDSQFARALDIQQKAYEALQLKHGDHHPATLNARFNLGFTTMGVGKYPEAVAIFDGLLKARENRDGPADRSTLLVRGRLGIAHLRAGRPDLAIPVLDRALTIWRSLQPEDGPDATVARADLAMAYTAAGQPARAVPLLEEAYAACEKRADQVPTDLIICRSNLGNALNQSGQFARAAELQEISRAAAEAQLGPNKLVTLQALNHLGMAYRYLGRTADAIKMLRLASDRATATFGPTDPNSLIFRLNVLAARREAGDVAAARAGLKELVEPAEKVFGPNHPNTLGLVQNLAEALEIEKQWDEALAGRQRVVDAERKRGSTGPALPLALVRLAQTLLAAGRPAAAEPVLREALAIRERTEADLWGTFLARAMLGAALAGQKKYAEAEPLLLEGYRGLQARAELIPYGNFKPLPWSREALVQLYTAWGKPAEAAKWRAEGEKK